MSLRQLKKQSIAPHELELSSGEENDHEVVHVNSFAFLQVDCHFYE